MNDPFNNAAFNVIEMTAAINTLPALHSTTADLFPVKGITGRTVLVEERNGTLALIPSAVPGAPSAQNIGPKRKVRSFVVPHFPLDDFVLPESVAGVRAFGTSDTLETVAGRLNDKLADMRAKHDATHEHLRIGALKGKILDADGSELYDLYDEFGITQKSIDLVLGTAGTDVLGKLTEAVRHVEDNLGGESFTGNLMCEISPELFDKFIKHDKVKELYLGYQAAQDKIGGDNRRAFTVRNVTFHEYRTQVGTTRFIAAGDGHAYPQGTRSTFATLAAPADFNEAVNTIGQPIYAKSEARKMGRGVDIHTQSNVLPICYRPAVLVRFFSSN